MKSKYDFYITTKDILFKFNDDLEILIKSGEPLLRVGYGIAHPELPMDSIYSINYIDYKNKNLIMKVEDEILIKEFENQFDYIIDTLVIDMTKQFLSNLEIYEEFIEIPLILKNSLLNKIENLFKKNGDLDENK